MGDDIDVTVSAVIKENPDAVEKYKDGKTQVIGFLVGAVMRELQGRANPNEIREKIIDQINK
jgi:aspartyl-tRNA(Asn)/glutamyl-tRNA(Gln) amidotransferase subunit B